MNNVQKNVFLKPQLFFISILLTLLVGCGGGLSSGGSVTGYLNPGDVHTIEFEATAGSSIYISVASDMQTYFTVVNPDETELVGTFNTYLTHDIQQTGTYKILLQTRYAGGEGNYELHYANSVDANENGLLTSGGVHSSDLTSNDIDSFTFEAVAGDSVHLTIDSSNQAAIYLFDPEGALLQSSFNILTAQDLALDGVYRIFVAGRYAFTTDNYELHFVNGTTATEMGFLTSGGMHSASLTSNDLDTFQFSAIAGDSIHLSTASSGQTFMRIFNPDGSFLTSGFNGMLVQGLPQNGDYRLVVQSRYAFTTDDYELHFVNTSSAVEHGSLPAQGSVSEVISVNDLDSYSVDLALGEDLALSATGDIPVRVYLYRPDGTLIGSGNNGYSLLDAEIGGTYTVVVAAFYAFQSGAYTLTSTVTQ